MKKTLLGLAVIAASGAAFARRMNQEDAFGQKDVACAIDAGFPQDAGGPANLATTVAQSADGKADVAKAAIDSDAQKPAMQQQQAGANLQQAGDDSSKLGATQQQQQQQ